CSPGGGAVLRDESGDRCFGIERELTRAGSDEAAREHAAGNAIELLGLERPQNRRADLRGTRQLLDRNAPARARVTDRLSNPGFHDESTVDPNRPREAQPRRFILAACADAQPYSS